MTRIALIEIHGERLIMVLQSQGLHTLCCTGIQPWRLLTNYLSAVNSNTLDEIALLLANKIHCVRLSEFDDLAFIGFRTISLAQGSYGVECRDTCNRISVTLFLLIVQRKKSFMKTKEHNIIIFSYNLFLIIFGIF